MQLTRSFTLSFLLFAMLLSCQTPTENTEVVDPAQAAQEQQKLEQQKLDEEMKRKLIADLAVKEEQEKLISNYRCIAGSEDLSVFSDLLKKSSFSKLVHNENTTIFAPSNKAFASNKEFTKTLQSGSKELIDDFVSAHIIQSDTNFKYFFQDGKVKALNGKEIRLQDGKEMKVNGQLIDGRFVGTKTGTVCYIETLAIQNK